MQDKVTMKDIAEKIGVSVVTVSKALNNKQGVSEQLRDKIKRTAQEMKYRYNSAAQAMRRGCSNNIGVVIPHFFLGNVDPFYLRFYRDLSTAANKYNYYSLLHLLSHEEEAELKLPQMYYDQKVDGIIFLGQVSEKYVEAIKTIEIPVVLVDFYDKNFEMDCVIQDNFYSSFKLTNYLISNNHSKIAFIGNIYASTSIQDRFLGYYKALLDNKIAIKDDYIINDRDKNGKYVDIIMPKDMPTAFVVNCDQVAYNLLNHIFKMGFKVPDDFSIVSFDNDIFAKMTNPKLTTVEPDMKAMAESAVKIIIDKLNNSENKSHSRVIVSGETVYRDSVRKL